MSTHAQLSTGVRAFAAQDPGHWTELIEFARAADTELGQAVPLERNAYKVTLARNLIAATLEELSQ